MRFKTISPGVRSGKPCVRDTRITEYDVLDYMAGGMTKAHLLTGFPSPIADDLRACIAFAAARERGFAG